MKWGAQVRHVLVKDVRQARWGIAAFIGFVALSTLRAFVSPDNPFLGSGIPSAVVLILGVVIAGSIVQADSPAAAKAFWASRPFFASAVLAAKLLFVVAFILLIPVLAQLIALNAFDSDPSWMIALGIGSGYTYGFFVLIAMLVASLTSDLRSFGLAYIATSATSLLTVTLFASRGTSQGGGYTPSLAILASIDILLYGALLCYVYRRRDASWRVWMALGACFALTAALAQVPVLTRAAATLSFPAPRLEFALAEDSHRSTPDRFSLHVSTIDAPRDAQLAIALDRIAIHLLSGEVLRPAGFRSGAVVHTALLPIAQGSAIVQNSPMFETPNVISVQLTDAESQRIRGGVSRVDVDGRLLAVRPRLVAEFSPTGAWAAQLAGARMRISDAVIGHDTVSAKVVTDYFEGGISGDYSYNTPSLRLDNPFVAIVNDRLHAAMLMRSIYDGRGGNGWFVLPGVNFGRDSRRLVLQGSFGDRGSFIGPDSIWLRNAHFAVYEWERLGSSPVHQTVDLRGG